MIARLSSNNHVHPGVKRRPDAADREIIQKWAETGVFAPILRSFCHARTGANRPGRDIGAGKTFGQVGEKNGQLSTWLPQRRPAGFSGETADLKRGAIIFSGGK